MTASAPLKLELAGLLIARGERDEARALLEPLAAGGRSAPGYGEALELLVPSPRLRRRRAGPGDGAGRASRAAEGSRARPAPPRRRAGGPAGRGRCPRRPSGPGLGGHRGEPGRAAAPRQPDARSRASWRRRPPRSPRPRSSPPPRTAPVCCSRPPTPGRGRGTRPRRRSSSSGWRDCTPATLGPGAWGNRFLRLGARAPAIEHGYEPLLAQGAFTQALEIAERLEDPARIRQSLWGLAQEPAGAEALRRLAKLLLAEGTAAERQACADLAESRRAMDLAVSLHRAILLSPARTPRARSGSAPSSGCTPWASGMARCSSRRRSSTPTPLRRWSSRCSSRSGPAAAPSASVGSGSSPPGCRPAPPTCGRRSSSRPATTTASRMRPRRSPHGWRRRPTRCSARGSGSRPETSSWPSAGSMRRARPGPWRAEDPTSIQASSKLLALTSVDESPAEFVELAERLSSLSGPDALDGRQDELVEAYVRLGRPAEALLLSQLPPTETRIRLRADLADSLGRSQEALALREQLANTPAEREGLAITAAPGRTARRRGAHPWRARVDRGHLAGFASGARHRARRERCGGRLAAQLWALLLAERPVDPEGWALHGEALRRAGPSGRQHAHWPSGASSPARRPPRPRSPSSRWPALRSTPRSRCRPAWSPSPPRRCPPCARCWTRRSGRSALPASRSGSIRRAPRRPGWPGRTTSFSAPARSRSSARSSSPSSTALALALGDAGQALARPGEVPALGRRRPRRSPPFPRPRRRRGCVLWLDPVARGADVDTIDTAAVLTGSAALAAVVQRALPLV